MHDAKKTHFPYAHQIFKAMEGENEYYINKDFTKAVKILKDAIEYNDSKFYPIKALASIYKRREMDYAAQELYNKYKAISPED